MNEIPIGVSTNDETLDPTLRVTGARAQLPSIPNTIGDVADAHALTEEAAVKCLTHIGLLYLREAPASGHRLMCTLAMIHRGAAEEGPNE